MKKDTKRLKGECRSKVKNPIDIFKWRRYAVNVTNILCGRYRMGKLSVGCCLGSLLVTALFGAEWTAPEETCERSERHMRVVARYTTPQGIGYKHGYATLEGFFAPRNFLGGAWLPFIDVRGHVFDNGKCAANGGIGCRYLSTSRLWGVNSYYDYRNTAHQHYNQVAVGLESLGRVWDFRLNGYLPIGWKQSPSRGFTFGRFQGNTLLIRSTKDFALKGANAEVGAHINHFKKAPLYFGAGPYYLTGKGATTWGGQFRAAVDLFSPYVRLEARTAYDHFFKWTGQGQISLNFSFGGRNQRANRAGESCGKAIALNNAALQPVERHEIIPTGKQHIFSPAINPATGEPYFFAFFNNTSHSLGTYESPYPTLAAVDGDILYVFPGDGSAYDTSQGGSLTEGLLLQNSQMLLGASTVQPIPTTVGVISIPALSTNLPLIATTDNSGNVVTLNDNNTISGFYIGGSTFPAIAGNGIANFTSNHNTVNGTASSSNSGIFLSAASGQININNTTFIYNHNGLLVDSGSFIEVLNVSDAVFTMNENGILIAGSVDALNILNTSFLHNFNDGIQFFNGSTTGSANISNSVFSNQANGVELDGSNLIDNLNVSSSLFDSNNTGIYANGQVNNTVNLSGNIFNNQVYNGFELTNNAVTHVNITGNSFNNNGQWDVALDSGNLATYVTLTNNEFHQTPIGFVADLTNASSCSVADNLFDQNGFSGISMGSTGTGSCVLDITDNGFKGFYTNPNAGYAANIAFSGTGEICVELVDNTSDPIINSSGGAAYLLSNTGSLFYVTESSENSNIGEITYTGVTFTPQCGR